MPEQPITPATSVAAPASQGRIGDKQLQILIFDHDAHDLRKHMAACAAEGCKPIGALVLNPSLSNSFTPKSLESFRNKQGADHLVFSTQEAKSLADMVNPHVIMTTAMSDGGIFSSGRSMELSDLATTQIPDILPAHIPMLVNTASGYTIHQQDGKNGQAIPDRHINLKEFLQNQAAKLNDQGRAQG